MLKHPLVRMLLQLRGNPRASVYTEPLWGIPYNLYAPYVSVYMLTLGLKDVQIGLIASIGLACPRQVAPEMPRKALREGIEGVVTAQIHVKGGRIVDVTILSGPRVFHAAVKAAMLQYTCITDGSEVIATQEFNFKVE